MIGQISASNQLRTSSEYVRSQLRPSSELAPNRFGASSEPASVIEFGFYTVRSPATKMVDDDDDADDVTGQVDPVRGER